MARPRPGSAASRALRRRTSRAGALPRLRFDDAAALVFQHDRAGEQSSLTVRRTRVRSLALHCVGEHGPEQQHANAHANANADATDADTGAGPAQLAGRGERVYPREKLHISSVFQPVHFAQRTPIWGRSRRECTYCVRQMCEVAGLWAKPRRVPRPRARALQGQTQCGEIFGLAGSPNRA